MKLFSGSFVVARCVYSGDSGIDVMYEIFLLGVVAYISFEYVLHKERGRKADVDVAVDHSSSAKSSSKSSESFRTWYSESFTLSLT